LKKNIANNLKPIFVILFAFSFLLVNAQQGNDSLRRANKLKIEAMMKQLEDLENKEAFFSTGTDDCEGKTLGLINQLAELQDLLKNNQFEIQRLAALLNENERTYSNHVSAEKINAKNSVHKNAFTEDIGAEYYIVLKSFRTLNIAEYWLKNSALTGVSVKRNLNQTWFHVVLDQGAKKSEVGKIVLQKRKSGFKNAWWAKKEYFE
jgi:hypothetical protein